MHKKKIFFVDAIEMGTGQTLIPSRDLKVRHIKQKYNWNAWEDRGYNPDSDLISRKTNEFSLPA